MHMANEPRLEDSEQNYTFATTRDILEVQELRACGDGQLENVIVPLLLLVMQMVRRQSLEYVFRV